MLNFAKLQEKDRHALFAATAGRLVINEAIIEKDFWVCWVLDYLFHESPWKDHLAFKGGTSLSKAYGVIQRFSEDIDLILDWTVLGYVKNEPWLQNSNNKRSVFCQKANERCTHFLAQNLVPELRNHLCKRAESEIKVWSEGQDVLIEYPKSFSEHSILPQIKLEIGPIAAWCPHEECAITPYAAECFGNKFTIPTTRIRTIKAERTFWDKVTILHQEAHREVGKALLPRYARHYYDLYRLNESPIKEQALRDLDLLAEVVRFKRHFYYCAWAGFDSATKGTLKLLPAPHNLLALQADYKKMQSMLFGPIPTFDDVLSGLSILENEINNL